MSSSHQSSQYRRHGHGRNTTQGSFVMPGAGYSYTPQRSYTIDSTVTRPPDYRATSSSNQFPTFDAKGDNMVSAGGFRPPSRRMATLPATFGYQGILQQEASQGGPSYQYLPILSSTSGDAQANYLPTITVESTEPEQSLTTLTMNEILARHPQPFVCQSNCWCEIRTLLFRLGNSSVQETFYSLHYLKVTIGNLLPPIDINSTSHFKIAMKGLQNGDARLILDLLDETSKIPAFHRICQDWISKLVRYSGQAPSSIFNESKAIVLKDQQSYAGGGFSDVHRCTLDGRPLAAKAPRIWEQADAAVFKAATKVWLREAIVWHHAHHPRILQFMGISTTLLPGRWCLLSPWMQAGNISKYLARADLIADLELCLSYSIQVVDGLAYLHLRGLFHGDVKSSNILIDDQGNVKISDLGLSSHHHTTQFRSGGDAQYMAPEISEGAPISAQTDVYSCGMTIFEIVSGIKPFSNLPRLEMIGAQARNGVRPERPTSRCQERLYDDLWTLITDCWSPNPVLRPSMGQVLQKLTSMPLRFREWSQYSFYSPHAVVYDGLPYCSAYSLFQALRFRNWPEVSAYIQQLGDSAQVRNYVSQLGNRPYDEQDLSSMEFCLHLKFQQHENLRVALLATENRYIYYISSTDTFWGYSGDSRQGQNRLGLCLMGIRKTLRSTIGMG